MMFPDEFKFSYISRRWLLIGVGSLAIAGIFSLVLVIARTPGFCDVPYFQKLFHEALVAHVDLSVLIWFLSIACLFWSLLSENYLPMIPYTTRAAQFCFIGAVAAISAAPFDPSAISLMSNYIPVIISPLFFVGLSLLLCGAGLMLLHLFTSLLKPAAATFSPEIRYGIITSAIIASLAIFAFIWSFKILPREIDGQQYYEMGFWGGGHVLQFVHTQILLLCWLWLASTLNPGFKPGPKLLYGLFSVGLIVALITPFPFFSYDITSGSYRAFFTDIMIIAGGLAPAILAPLMIPLLWKSRAKCKGEQRAIWASLLMSMLLFIYGGFLAGLIRGQNVVIPAHYHGSIVGVTLAFMGISYLLLPRFGYRNVAGGRLAFWQVLAYGLGQIMHISGLAYSGGYGGLQRKTPCGASVEIAGDIKAAMGIMGMGGLLAIIGGFMFVILVAGVVYEKKN